MRAQQCCVTHQSRKGLLVYIWTHIPGTIRQLVRKLLKCYIGFSPLKCINSCHGQSKVLRTSFKAPKQKFKSCLFPSNETHAEAMPITFSTEIRSDKFNCNLPLVTFVVLRHIFLGQWKACYVMCPPKSTLCPGARRRLPHDTPGCLRA